jgi:hypothetical protein
VRLFRAILKKLCPSPDGEDVVKRDIKKLRHATTLHYAESSNAWRASFDHVDARQQEEDALNDLVKFMTNNRARRDDHA